MAEVRAARDTGGRPRLPADSRYKVKSLGRALDLLDVLAGRGRGCMSLTEIARALDDNICRCGAHTRIIDAIQTAAREMKGGT